MKTKKRNLYKLILLLAVTFIYGPTLVFAQSNTPVNDEKHPVIIMTSDGGEVDRVTGEIKFPPSAAKKTSESNDHAHDQVLQEVPIKRKQKPEVFRTDDQGMRIKANDEGVENKVNTANPKKDK